MVGKKTEVGNGAAEMGTGLAPTAGYPNPGKTPAVWSISSSKWALHGSFVLSLGTSIFRNCQVFPYPDGDRVESDPE